jgi:hypothetical protein
MKTKLRADRDGRLLFNLEENKNMITYIKSNLFFMKLKMELYKALSHSEDYIEMFTKLAMASKDMTPEEVKSEFLKEFAGVVHDYLHKGDDKESGK